MGATSFWVAERTNELGLRAAIGATPRLLNSRRPLASRFLRGGADVLVLKHRAVFSIVPPPNTGSSGSCAR